MSRFIYILLFLLTFSLSSLAATPAVTLIEWHQADQPEASAATSIDRQPTFHPGSVTEPATVDKPEIERTGKFTVTERNRSNQLNSSATGTDGTFKIARVQYRGGGDWYTSPTALTNMIDFATQQVPIRISREYDDVPLGSRDLHNYPMVYISGHGNIEVNSSEMENLRNYLQNGGFLYVDDDYGLDQYVRPILQDIFPDEDFIELPPDHPIYRNVNQFPDGRPPKVHEHDGQPPQAFAVYRDGRMVLLYTYESNPSDGWAYDQHNNPEEIVQAALQFGVNLLVYVFTSQ